MIEHSCLLRFKRYLLVLQVEFRLISPNFLHSFEFPTVHMEKYKKMNIDHVMEGEGRERQEPSSIENVFGRSEL